ncbi:MAG: hypothetical protein ACQR33_06515 [Candidatus Saccharibacteria bacterium]
MYKINSQQSVKRSKTRKKKIAAITVATVSAIVIIILVLEFTDTTHIFHKSNPTVTSHGSTADQNTKGENSLSQTGGSASTTQKGQTTAPVTGSGATTNGGGSTTTAALIAPSGNFVSNHHPNLGGSPAPNILTSVCNTTPGATCTITFTNASTGAAKSLTAQTADSGGAAYWSWKLQDVGLGQGTWQVKATATLGNQTKSASDAMTLEVQP